MVVSSPERNKSFECKTILLFCPPNWELTEMGLLFTEVEASSTFLVTYELTNQKAQ